LFKTNSRFAALACDIPAKKDKNENKNIINDKKEVFEDKQNYFKSENKFKSENNSFKNDGYRERRHNRYNNEYDIKRVREQREADEKTRKEAEEIRKQKALTPDNFPDLVLNNNMLCVKQEHNYLEKIKKAEAERATKQVANNLEKLKPGWILLEKDNLSRKTIMKGKESVLQTPELLEEDVVKNVINKLSELHEQRTKNYIELNDYDTWEKTFKFAHWMEREFDLDEESDYDSDSDDTVDENVDNF
jgi:hypothetical protein